MLKFPSMVKRNSDVSYSNSCFSEYLGCQIYENIGIPVQKTLLGTYTVKGHEKIVVACGDFTEPGVTLQDFASLKNQMIDSERNGYGTEYPIFCGPLRNRLQWIIRHFQSAFGICLLWMLLLATGIDIMVTGGSCIIPLRMKSRWHLFMIAEAVFILRQTRTLWNLY